MNDAYYSKALDAVKNFPSPEDVLNAFRAVGVRPYVFDGKLGFCLERNHDWNAAQAAFDLLERLPGQCEALKRYLESL